MKNSTPNYFREILNVQTHPPRQVKYATVLRVAFTEEGMKIVFFFGLAMWLLFIPAFFTVKSSDRIFFFLVGLIPLSIIASPFYYAYRLWKAIKFGKVLSARVESVKYSQASNNTLEAIENGFAQGSYRLPEGRLINFQIDQSWAKDIKVGSHVEVLVVSPKFRGIFPLGLSEK